MVSRYGYRDIITNFSAAFTGSLVLLQEMRGSDSELETFDAVTKKVARTNFRHPYSEYPHPR